VTSLPSQQEEPRTLGQILERFVIVGRAKKYPPLDAPGMYLPRGSTPWAHWVAWRIVAASRGDRAAMNDLTAAITLAESYTEPDEPLTAGEKVSRTRALHA
jgi:hypothetical protein